MKKQQYYNILPRQLYESNNLDLIVDHLVANNICQKCITHSYSSKLEKTDVLGEMRSKSRKPEIYDSLRFNDEVTSELYNFLLTHYQAGLGNYIPFSVKFQHDTFGLNYIESKKIAISYFDFYYNQISINPSFELKFDENRKIIPATKLEALKRNKDCLHLNLGNKTELIFPYLAGDNSFFNRELFENNLTIIEIFEFENNLKILLELNNKYQLEEDHVFGNKSKAKQIFENFENEFDSLKQLENKSNQNHGFIVSLFYFFKDELQIKRPSARIFREIIMDYFEINFGKIKLSDPQNEAHKKRIDKLNNSWEKFTT